MALINLHGAVIICIPYPITVEVFVADIASTVFIQIRLIRIGEGWAIILGTIQIRSSITVIDWTRLRFSSALLIDSSVFVIVGEVVLRRTAAGTLSCFVNDSVSIIVSCILVISALTVQTAV